MAIKVREKTEDKVVVEPRFRDASELTEAQLSDPDYRLKQIAREAGIPENKILICSKCHHCR